MSSRINSGQKLFDSLINNRVVSQSGGAWVTISIDPMHDLPLEHLCGYPDAQDGQSIVLKIPKEFVVEAGPEIEGQWQFLLMGFPWTTGANASGPMATQYNLFGNYLQLPSAQANATQFFPPVCVYKGLSGTNLGPFNLDDAGNFAPQGVGIDDNYCKGSHRVIGWGIEVYNTTPVIERQGNVTVWKQNTNTYNKSTFVYASPTAGPATHYGACSGIVLQRPPQNIAEANLLSGTLSWKAEDGCYLVMRQNQEQLLAKQPDDTQFVMSDGDFSPGIRNYSSQRVISGSTYQINTGEETGVNIPNIVWNMQPFHMSGAFFTGLGPKSTFLVRTIFYVERFPTPDEKDIVLLTKSSAAHDPTALMLYDECLKRMPVGVPVAENGLGEWFYDALKSSLPLIKAIPHPIAQAIGGMGQSFVDFNNQPKARANLNKKKNLPRNNGPEAPPPPAQSRPPPQKPKKKKPAKPPAKK